MKPKILIITTTFLRWEDDKIPSFVYSFAQAIKEKLDVHVLAPHTTRTAVYETMNGVKIHRFRYAPESLEKLGAGTSIVSTLKNDPKILLLIPSFMFFATLNIIKLELRNRFDIIHVNWMIPFGPVVGLIRRFAKFRYVITSHGSDVFPVARNPNFFSFLIILLHKMFTVPYVDHIVAVSKPLKEAIIKLLPEIPESKISIIGMGINYHQFSSQAITRKIQKTLRLIFVGRLAEVKGVKYLIDAISLLRNGNIDVELHIYGDGLLRRPLEEQAERLGLANCIVFKGFRTHSDLAARLAESDIFVGPSITTSIGEAEGLGLVFLEAMAAGVAVIGTNVGGIPDIVVDKRTGILVEEKNAEAIVRAIELLADDENLRAEIIDRGRTLAKDYDWTVIAQKHLQVYGFERNTISGVSLQNRWFH